MTEELSAEEIAQKEVDEQVRRTVALAKEQEELFGRDPRFESEYFDNQFEEDGLSEKEMAFVEHFLVYQNPTAAIVQVGLQTNFPKRTATRLLQKPAVQRFLKSLILQARQNVGLTLEQHLRSLGDIRDRALAKGDNKTALGAERSRGEAAGFYTRLSAYEMNLIEQKNQELLGEPDKPISEMDTKELREYVEKAMQKGITPPKVLDVEPLPEEDAEEEDDSQGGKDYKDGSQRSFFGNRKSSGILKHSRVVQRGIADKLEPYEPQKHNVE